jgi:AcrR family transcriptional regulator
MVKNQEPAALSGRRREAARNDEVILRAARTVFLADPKAPVSAVAAAAGVGISALYRRYASKEDLLRTLCHEGLLRYIAEAEEAVAQPDGWAAFTTFLQRIVDADVHSLTVHLAGTFTPTADMWRDAEWSGALTAQLFARARASGKLRPGVVVEDISFLLEGTAAIRLPDQARTAELRRRYVALFIDALADTGAPVPPGPPPRAGELNRRWQTGPPQPGHGGH